MMRFLRWLGLIPLEPVSENPGDSVSRETEKINLAVEALRAQAQIMTQTAKETDRMRSEVLR